MNAARFICGAVAVFVGSIYATAQATLPEWKTLLLQGTVSFEEVENGFLILGDSDPFCALVDESRPLDSQTSAGDCEGSEVSVFVRPDNLKFVLALGAGTFTTTGLSLTSSAVEEWIDQHYAKSWFPSAPPMQLNIFTTSIENGCAPQLGAHPNFGVYVKPSTVECLSHHGSTTISWPAAARKVWKDELRRIDEGQRPNCPAPKLSPFGSTDTSCKAWKVLATGSGCLNTDGSVTALAECRELVNRSEVAQMRFTLSDLESELTTQFKADESSGFNVARVRYYLEQLTPDSNPAAKQIEPERRHDELLKLKLATNTHLERTAKRASSQGAITRDMMISVERASTLLNRISESLNEQPTSNVYAALKAYGGCTPGCEATRYWECCKQKTSNRYCLVDDAKWEWSTRVLPNGDVVQEGNSESDFDGKSSAECRETAKVVCQGVCE